MVDTGNIPQKIAQILPRNVFAEICTSESFSNCLLKRFSEILQIIRNVSVTAENLQFLFN